MQILLQRDFERLLCKEQDLEISTLNNNQTTKVAYNQQRNKCVIILKKSKRSYFESLDVKFVKDNKKFCKKKSLPFFKQN